MKASPARGVWKYVNGSASPPAGIFGVAVKDLVRKAPGLVQFTMKARRGAYGIDTGRLPLTGLFVLDPPTAETGLPDARVSERRPDRAPRLTGRSSPARRRDRGSVVRGAAASSLAASERHRPSGDRLPRRREPARPASRVG